MIVVTNVKKVSLMVREAKKKGKRVALVPTMGALHLGHLSLIRAAKKESDFVVVSIFVNPTQFGPGEDYKKYPRDLKRDQSLLRREGVDLLFYPKLTLVYPKDFSVYVEEYKLTKHLCGLKRTGHFKGVCTVVAKLFNIVDPDVSYFGQKDYQQVQIIKRLVRDLNFGIKIRTLPIVRDKDGLAMSSRNSYLNAKERKAAICLYQAIKLAKEYVKQGCLSSRTIIGKLKLFLQKQQYIVKVDYINIVDPSTLEDVKRIRGKVLVALSVYVNKVRLIDNAIIQAR